MGLLRPVAAFLITACFGLAVAAETESLAARLDSPVGEVRRRAEIDLDALPASSARAFVDAHAASTSSRLRAAVVRARGRLAEARDFRAIELAIEDADPIVARAAAEAWTDAARGDRLERNPPVEAGVHRSAAAMRALAFALAGPLESGADASFVLRLGEGVVASLALCADLAPDGSEMRRGALCLLGRIGGADARTAVAAGGPRRWLADFDPWCAAVVALGAGPGFEEVDAWVVGTVLSSEAASEQFALRRRRGPWQQTTADASDLLLTFARGREAAVRDVLREWLSRGDRWMKGRLGLARSLLALSPEPSVDDLLLLVDASRPPFNRRARLGSSHDGLAEILRWIAPYVGRDDEVRHAVRQLVVSSRPAIHRAWARCLVEGADSPGLADTALSLLLEEPPQPDRQRLAAQLLDRIGPPPPGAIEAAGASSDGWLRAWSVRRRAQRGSVEDAAEIERALADPDDRVLLEATEAIGPPRSGPARRRLVELAALAPAPGTRIRAAAALLGEATESSASPGSEPLGPSPEEIAFARLDDRLRWRFDALRADR